MWTSRICQRVIAGTRKSTAALWRMLSKARRISREWGSLLQYVYAFGFFAFVTTDFLKSFRFQE